MAGTCRDATQQVLAGSHVEVLQRHGCIQCLLQVVDRVGRLVEEAIVLLQVREGVLNRAAMRLDEMSAPQLRPLPQACITAS